MYGSEITDPHTVYVLDVRCVQIIDDHLHDSWLRECLFIKEVIPLKFSKSTAFWPCLYHRTHRKIIICICRAEVKNKMARSCGR